MTPDEAERTLESPLRLVLLAELRVRPSLTLREAVLVSGRHEQDVVAAMAPLVRARLITQNDDVFEVTAGLDEAVAAALDRGIAARRERLERERFVRRHVLGSMIGIDPKMQLVFEAIRQVCRLDVSVLITGETGAGKELVARAVHELGARCRGNMAAVNCATVPSSLFESHMFGHVRGSFSGATHDHVGVVEHCDGGTLFLDEIGELEPQNQSKLLRVLQDRTFCRLGDHVPRRSNFRLISATHRDLPAMVKAGTFREDLFYRCNVFAIRVPSLRERPADLPYIAEEVLRSNLQSLGLSIAPPITEEALASLASHRWPGNVRELANVMVRATISAAGAPIRTRHLQLTTDDLPPEAPQPSRTLAEVERAHVQATVIACDGNLRLAAQRLGIARATLYRLLERHQIPRP